MSGILKDLQSTLDKNGTIILDGGLSSELERQGADLSGSLWSAR
jgi:S-methylmethionine-dependent homocysteine/selenocysteine methylase